MSSSVEWNHLKKFANMEFSYNFKERGQDISVTYDEIERIQADQYYERITKAMIMKRAEIIHQNNPHIEGGCCWNIAEYEHYLWVKSLNENKTAWEIRQEKKQEWKNRFQRRIAYETDQIKQDEKRIEENKKKLCHVANCSQKKSKSCNFCGKCCREYQGGCKRHKSHKPRDQRASSQAIEVKIGHVKAPNERRIWRREFIAS